MPSGLRLFRVVAGRDAYAYRQSSSENRSTRFDMIHATEIPAPITARRPFVCGRIAVTVGSCIAKTIGSTFGRIYFSDTESHLPRQTRCHLALRLIVASESDAMRAAKNTSINPQK